MTFPPAPRFRPGAPRRSRALSGLALTGVLVLGLLSLTAVQAQDEADALAEGLIRLRGEVEALNTELELLREEQRTALGALNTQKAELSAGAERQRLAAREAREKVEAARAVAADAGVAQDTLQPALMTAIDALQRYIATGLPFKVQERLGELDTFRSELQNGTLPPQRAVNRLWAFFEDEFRLTRENALYSQTIDLDGERVLADVAKLGSMALYYRTRDGRFGHAVSGADGWRFEPITDATASAQVANLFDALGKQIRQGWFELPLAAHAGAAR